MKVAIVGTGAMGSIYACLLGAAGNEVWAVDVWKEHIDAIRAGGIRVSGASGDRTVRVNATTDAAEPGICDLVVIATKAMHVEQAAESAKAMIGQGTLVLTVQNGLGSYDRVQRVLGDAHVAIGVVGGFGASIRAPGHSFHNGMEMVRFGEPSGAPTPRLEETAALWRQAGFKVDTFDDIQRMIWDKLILNVGFNATCALTGMTVGQVAADPNAWRIAWGCAGEAARVAEAKGVRLTYAVTEEHLKVYTGKIPATRPSTAQDHAAGKRTEIDALNGAIVAAAKPLGVPTPWNEAVTALIKARESLLPA